jgi:hypothetical protein
MGTHTRFLDTAGRETRVSPGLRVRSDKTLHAPTASLARAASHVYCCAQHTRAPCGGHTPTIHALCIGHVSRSAAAAARPDGRWPFTSL